MKMIDITRHEVGGVVTYTLWPLQFSLNYTREWELKLCVWVFPVLFVVDTLGLWALVITLLITGE